jgi:hypothetical protein
MYNGLMDTTNDVRITESEAGSLLGISAAGVTYLVEAGQLRAHPGRRSIREYRLGDVLALVEYRRQHPAKCGRPSAQAMLARKLKSLSGVRQQRELVEVG